MPSIAVFFIYTELMMAVEIGGHGGAEMKYYTAAALGRVLGIGESEIKALTRRGMIKKGVAENGLYDIEQAAREIIAMLRDPEARKQSADYQAERARFMRLKRQGAEYDLSLREGTLHRTEDLELAISKMLVSFKSRVRSIPARVSPQAAKMTSQEDIFDLLKQVTDEVLQELSDIDTIFSEEESQT